MVEGWGDLSGPGPQQVYINNYRTGYQNWAENWTEYRIVVVYDSKGFGSWSNTDQSWEAWGGGGARWGGKFRISSPGTANITLLDTTYRVYHDGNGFMGGFGAGATINTDHSRIGSGSVYVSEPAAPRIPKRPSEPGTPNFSEALPTSVRVSWGGSGDDRGSAIYGYLLRYWRNTSPTGPYVDHSFENNTSRLVTGLTPGQHYTFAVYARNSAAEANGYSPESGKRTIRMLAGVRMKVNGAWKMAIIYIKVNGTWKMALPYIKVNGTWRMTS